MRHGASGFLNRRRAVFVSVTRGEGRASIDSNAPSPGPSVPGVPPTGPSAECPGTVERPSPVNSLDGPSSRRIRRSGLGDPIPCARMFHVKLNRLGDRVKHRYAGVDTCCSLEPTTAVESVDTPDLTHRVESVAGQRTRPPSPSRGTFPHSRPNTTTPVESVMECLRSQSSN